MHVLVGEQHRLRRREARRAARPAPASVSCFWRCGRQIERRVAAFRRHAEQRRDQRHRLLQPVACRAPAAPRACRAAPRADRRARSRRPAPAARSPDAARWWCDGASMVELSGRGARRSSRARSVPDQTRLADPGLAREQHHLALAVLGPAAQRSQQDARARARARPAASGPPSAAPRSGPSARPSPSTRKAASGSAKPLRRRGPRSASSNRPPTQPARRLADHHAARRRRAPAAAPRGSASRRPPSAPAPRPRRSARRP